MGVYLEYLKSYKIEKVTQSVTLFEMREISENELEQIAVDNDLCSFSMFNHLSGYLAYLKAQKIVKVNEAVSKFEKKRITIDKLQNVARAHDLWQFHTYSKNIKINRILMSDNIRRNPRDY